MHNPKALFLISVWAVAATCLAVYYRDQSVRLQTQLDNSITLPQGPKKPWWGEPKPDAKPTSIDNRAPCACNKDCECGQRCSDCHCKKMPHPEGDEARLPILFTQLPTGMVRPYPEQPGTTEYGRPDGQHPIVPFPRPPDGSLVDLSWLKGPADRIAAAAERTSQTIDDKLGAIPWIMTLCVAGGVALVMNILHTNSLARSKLSKV